MVRLFLGYRNQVYCDLGGAYGGDLGGGGGGGVVITVGIRSSLPTTVLNRENPKKMALRGH